MKRHRRNISSRVAACGNVIDMGYVIGLPRSLLRVSAAAVIDREMFSAGIRQAFGLNSGLPSYCGSLLSIQGR